MSVMFIHCLDIMNFSERCYAEAATRYSELAKLWHKARGFNTQSESIYTRSPKADAWHLCINFQFIGN